jgi:hypothetical protein
MRRNHAIAALLGTMLLAAQATPALEIKDAKNAPEGYVRVLETTDKEGKRMVQYTFGTASATMSGRELNEILAAYGLSLRDVKKAPADYATESESTDKDGRKVKQHAFGTTPTTISEHELNQILSAYGVGLADLKKAPDGYAREVETKGQDGKIVKSHVFSTTPRTMSGAELNQILGAYK